MSARAIDEIRLRRSDRVVTECGCIVIPGSVVTLLGAGWVSCPDHGDQKIVRNATGREVTEMVLGMTIPVDSETDTIPF